MAHDGPATEGTSVERAQTAPHEDDARKPESPPDLTRRSWVYTFKGAFAEFNRDQCLDIAAALTYYAVLALFPALLALVSLLGVFGRGEATTDALLELVRQIGQGTVADQLKGPISQMTQTQSAGFGLVFGLLGALWSASGYIAAFSRGMNRIYQIDEGRPFWKLRPLQIGLTLASVVLTALVLVGLVVSGPLAESVGAVVGLGDGAVMAWNVVKWPVMLAIVVAVVALLYYAAPNIRQPKFRWMSVGAAIAIITWVIASAAFGFYVANFGSYNKTYGSLAGVIVFLLWLWLTNLALLFGAEVDAELERSRELQAGIEAERVIQLPPRDTRASEKAARKREQRIERGRQLRLAAERRRARSGGDDGPS
jgi:membrane protein